MRIQSHTKLTYRFITVNGEGYELLQNNVDYKIRSSLRKTPPTDISEGNSKKRSIHVELATDLFSSERFVEVSLSAEIVLSGLLVVTKRSMALEQFSVSYAEQDVQYPGGMKTIQVFKQVWAFTNLDFKT